MTRTSPRETELRFVTSPRGIVFATLTLFALSLLGDDITRRAFADARAFVLQRAPLSYSFTSNDDFVDHQLYILRESSTRPELEIVSTLPNDSRPEEIGKPNEALYGVRFLGDVAYAVTFERIDPLYAIDLSIPADPFIAGELEVTGFSDFLHPVTDDLLLGLGRSAEGGIKVELFDVSSIAQPLSRQSTYYRGPFTIVGLVGECVPVVQAVTIDRLGPCMP